VCDLCFVRFPDPEKEWEARLEREGSDEEPSVDQPLPKELNEDSTALDIGKDTTDDSDFREFFLEDSEVSEAGTVERDEPRFLWQCCVFIDEKTHVWSAGQQ